MKSQLRRLIPNLRQRFESLSGSDGLFPILSKRQMEYIQSSTIPDTKKSSTREAAVLIPLIEIQNEIHIVFTKRSLTMRSHKAEIAFPGGGRELSDETLMDTALREASEELQHSSSIHWTPIGICAPVPSLYGKPVTSVLAVHTLPITDLSMTFPGCPKEVDRVFSVRLETLMENETSKPLGRLGSPAPVYNVEGEEIWGLTAFILRPILRKILMPVLMTDTYKDANFL
jgi:8-oxo-dGTP pyrophosphatase MutT (NUDIX family)